MNKPLLLSLMLFSSAAFADTQLPDWWYDWQKKSENSRQVIQTMTQHANLLDADKAFNSFVATFDDKVKIHGLTEKTETKAIIKEHYYPVFYFLKLALVNDVLIASGDLVMERYHAWRAFDKDSAALEFDGCQFKPSSGSFSIRGYTLFKISNNKISERFSNHDHGYRYQQTCNDKTKGDEIKANLAGGFKDDKQVYAWGKSYLANLSHINLAYQQRLDHATAMFSKDAKIYGIKKGEGDIKDYQAYLNELWTAFPDLIYHQNGAATAWGRLAINYQAAGSHRAKWHNSQPDHQPVLLRGEIILEFDQAGKIHTAHIYDHLDLLDQDYY